MPDARLQRTREAYDRPIGILDVMAVFDGRRSETMVITDGAIQECVPASYKQMK